MKLSGGWLLVLLALALVVAMVMTLLLGGNRSRHGYGDLPGEADSIATICQLDGESGALSTFQRQFCEINLDRFHQINSAKKLKKA